MAIAGVGVIVLHIENGAKLSLSRAILFIRV